MKKSKILVPAVALLALSTAAATTGTVAWFTTNRQVTASTLTAAIASSQDLRISDSLSPSYAWSTSVRWDLNDTSLIPVTPVAGSLNNVTAVLKDASNATLTANPIFLSPNSNNTVDPATGEADHAPATGTSNGQYYQVIESHAYLGEDFALKYEGSKTVDGSVVTKETVNGVVTFTSTEGRDIDKALRLGVYSITDQKFTVYNVTNSTGATYTVNLSAIELESGVAKEYRVFIYYEGSDAACINKNAVTHPLSVGFTFTLA